MSNSVVHSRGWVSVNISVQNENSAKKIRAERDKQYGNIYVEKSSDERWVGDLGEMAFNSWLKHREVSGFEWVLDGAAGKPDFILAQNLRIGVKTVKRSVPPREGYTAQITAKHASEPTDHFFFMSYEIAKKKMWLLGGITQSLFLQEAQYHSAGEWVHSNYQIRQGHEIYNMDIANLVPPDKWLSKLISHRAI